MCSSCYDYEEWTRTNGHHWLQRETRQAFIGYEWRFGRRSLAAREIRQVFIGYRGRFGRRPLAAKGDLTGVHWLQREI